MDQPNSRPPTCSVTVNNSQEQLQSPNNNNQRRNNPSANHRRHHRHSSSPACSVTNSLPPEPSSNGLSISSPFSNERASNPDLNRDLVADTQSVNDVAQGDVVPNMIRRRSRSVDQYDSTSSGKQRSTMHFDSLVSFWSFNDCHNTHNFYTLPLSLFNLSLINTFYIR